MQATVRYIVDEVDPAVTFYTGRLGFSVEMRPEGAGFAMLSNGPLRLLLNEPGAGGAGAPADDGRAPEPGGWSRFQLEVTDLDAELAALRDAGARIRTSVVGGRAGRQIVIEDPSGNAVELFEPVSAGAGGAGTA
jgi:catechol 2,3-dioxygenase-like lactoylglutathione lyase family enzyme